MNLTVRTKLLGGFLLILMLLILTILLVTRQLAEANKRLDNMVNFSAEKVALSQELMILILQVTRYEKNLILGNELATKEIYRNKANESIATIDQKIPELEALITDAGNQDVMEFKSTWTKFKKTLEEIFLLAIRNENEKAFEMSSVSLSETREVLISTMEGIKDRNVRKMDEDTLINAANYKAALQLITVLILAGILFSIGIVYWIVRGITNRITYISGEAEKISSREHSEYKIKDPVKDELTPIIQSLININESFLEITQNANTVASGDYTVDIRPRSNQDSLGNALKKMTHSLRETTAENEKHSWLSTGLNKLNENLRGDQDIEVLANHIITFLADYTGAQIGAVYIMEDREKVLVRRGQYALSSASALKEFFSPGEGLIGQAAVENKTFILNDLKDHDVRISSSILDTRPANLIIIPFSFEQKSMGVIEMGRLTEFNETEKEFIHACMENIAISIHSAKARKQIQGLLEETQVQSEELQVQQEELRQMNEELEEQTQNLKQQQEELQMTNEELEEQTQSLEVKNKEVEAARKDIEEKTKQLEISSRYKSEFLANMSHELRTPLNSLLILSKDLADNKRQNLTPDQVESADIINKSGHDLLGLINEVLDLSKIEAGKMELTVERFPLRDLVYNLNRNFKHQAENKGLQFSVQLGNELPEAIQTDSKRLDQVIKNLMSNAIKFTDSGSITVNINRYDPSSIAIAVTDTGVGIAQDKQMAVFEAFHQGDGSTSRKYGGTGLGLSISREFSKILGGEIKLVSALNEGSTFTLILPIIAEKINALHPTFPKSGHGPRPIAGFENQQNFQNLPALEDDAGKIEENDILVLIIEDDLKFASILLNQCHEKGFKGLSASTGEKGLWLADRYKPHAIILDIDLPGMNGYQVLSELKSNPSVRHIPVHIMSIDERTIEAIKDGAVEYLKKPVDKNQLDEVFNRIENFINRKMKNLLIIEDDENSRKAIRKLIGNGDVRCFEAENGRDAITLFSENHIDCIVLDLGLPDISGFELIYNLESLKGGQIPPIVIYTGRELSKEENNELRKYAETIIIKGVKSEERLLDETALFLHRTISNLPESKQKIISGLYDKDILFHGKKILAVDDDMRNVFALAKILKERNMVVFKAENGLIALETLNQYPDIDLVLMDIMMPEMDGYETMRNIRKQPQFHLLPIIALTAKAMKEDKQKCIDAGANDYITKPIDVDRLLSLMRVWLSK